MARKGKLLEIFSKAQYGDNPLLYTVGYRDFEVIREVSLPEFLRVSNNFETIPITRIEFVKKSNKILFLKSKRGSKGGNS
ncbi:MAG: DUF504 domain-containing protein [Nitrosopumilaceae archaeon]